MIMLFHFSAEAPYISQVSSISQKPSAKHKVRMFVYIHYVVSDYVLFKAEVKESQA